MPEAVRNSVSMRSEITGARAGIRARNSSSFAARQAAVAAYAPTASRKTSQAHLLKMHNSPLQRCGRGLGAIREPQLAEQAIDVGFDRGLGNREGVGNLFVAVSSH